MSEKQLMEFWNYTESDLNANRHNQLTERQKTLLAETLKETRSGSFVLGLIIMGIFGFLIAATLTKPLMSAVGNLASGGAIETDTIAILAVFGLLLLIFIGIGIGFIKKMTRKPDYAIRHAEGMVNFVWVESKVRTQTGSGHKTVRSLEMHVGAETKFIVEDKLPNLINQGEEWAVYYTSYPFMFLSAEKTGK